MSGIGNTIETDLVGELVEIHTYDYRATTDGGPAMVAKGRVRAALGTADGNLILYVEKLDGDYARYDHPSAKAGDLVRCYVDTTGFIRILRAGT